MSRIANFERRNRNLLENLKKRIMHGILGVTAISTSLSVTNSIDPSILANYGIIALIVYVTVNIIWGIEQRHDLTTSGESEGETNQTPEKDEEPSSPEEPEKEEA
jgi:hypothetical protein